MTTSPRGIFCNRTLNFKSIRAIGYDMDYTLVHYRVEEWEKRTFDYLKQHFGALGWPVHDLKFDSNQVARGLIVDMHQGNLLKANRFGFVKKAYHGTQPLDFEKQREMYSRTIIELSEPRWVFLNTLFSISEGCMYAQLVDRLDEKRLPGVLGYADLYRRVRDATDGIHAEGRLKAEIIADPDRFILLDDEAPLALMDQKAAGKKLMLITNSEWSYTVPIMSYSFDRFLPKGMSWRDLFDLVVIGARKPGFFTSNNPSFEIVTPEGLMSPLSGPMKSGSVYFGGSAASVEKHLGLSGDEILYVGDHMFGDVHVSKSALRWRTALILRELEDEIQAVQASRDRELQLARLMDQKEVYENEICQVRLQLQRLQQDYGQKPAADLEALHHRSAELRQKLEVMDREIGPLAKSATELSHPIWGLLMRAGNDKSHLAFQIERYADIYSSRVSNFLHATPFVYLRSPRGSLPHDLSLD